MATSRRATVAVALATLLSALAIADYLSWLANHRRLVALARSSGLTARVPEIVRELERQTVPARATGLLAGTLLEVETASGSLSELGEVERAAEAARGVERLRLAASLSEEIVLRRPASWRAAMVLGTSRFLAASRRSRWDEPRVGWRRPLAAAARLAPGQPEPSLLLAGAELSRWSALDPEERKEALPVLRRALEGNDGLALLLPTWVRLAPSLESLFEAIPDRAQSWERLAAEFLALGDLERYALARERWRARLPAALADRVHRARARLSGGDRLYARGQADALVEPIPELRLTDSLAAALEILEGEPLGPRTNERLRRWLDWALELCLLGRCPLDPDGLRRLAAAVPDLPPADRALAAAAGGEAGAAEPAPEDADGAAWNRYWIYRAARLADRDPKAAQRALERAAPLAPDRLRYWLAQEAVASATADEQALARARNELAARRGPSWLSEAWEARGGVRRLELLVTEPASGVRLAVDGLRPPGAAVELRWDGLSQGIRSFPVAGSQSWSFPITPGVHQVEIEDLLGYTPTPRSLTLLAAPPAL